MLFAGMRFGEFYDIPSILAVECSGEALDSNTVLLTMTLYSPAHDVNSRLASLSYVQTKCLTYRTFTSCLLDPRDSRKTRLQVLVMDMEEGESRTFGCTIGYETNGWTQSVSWSLVVRRNGE